MQETLTADDGDFHVKSELYKVLLIGDAGVGKTSLLQMFVNNEFMEQYKNTIGSDFAAKKVKIWDEETASSREISLQLWDTAGQERFQALGAPFYRGSQICILVYDINSVISFEKLQTWKDEFLEHSNLPERHIENFPFLVVGNKVDKNQREVSRQRLLRLCKSWGSHIRHFETSAKLNQGVTELFQEAALIAFKHDVPGSQMEEYRAQSIFQLDKKKGFSSERCCD